MQQVIRMEEEEGEHAILARLKAMQDVLDARLCRIERTVALAEAPLQVLNDGLHAYTHRHVRAAHREAQVAAAARVLDRSRRDAELRYPHHKLLGVLLDQYDVARRQFREVHFSRLVKEARVAKNRAKQYLSALERKAYVRTRSDGYRKFIKIRT